jgi:hypothetical protein
MIGSTEFEWQHPLLANHEDAARLRIYLKDLVGAGVNWEFAPTAAHTICPISRDETITDTNGKVHPNWEVEGTAVFAREAATFIESLPVCVARQSATWEKPSSFPALGP